MDVLNNVQFTHTCLALVIGFNDPCIDIWSSEGQHFVLFVCTCLEAGYSALLALLSFPLQLIHRLPYILRCMHKLVQLTDLLLRHLVSVRFVSKDLSLFHTQL
jgi:hypothetical protein